MELKVDFLPTLWEPIPLQFQVPVGTTKVLGFDPLRWLTFFSIPSAIVAMFELVPLSANSGIHFSGSTLGNNPLIVSQKDHGLIACGEWYCVNTGGVFDLSILSLRWKG